MNEMREVLKDVLREAVPSPEEKKETRRLADKILKKAYECVRNHSIEPMFCGSIAKDTWLSGHKDLDLFLLFPERVSEDDLERVGLETAKKVVEGLGGRWEISFAEHPYLKAEIQGHDVDIVPAYDVPPDEIKSSVDRTPHHVRYVQKELDKNLLNEVRLLKRFCKGAGVYGSDLRTEGFSGYLCELLVIEYGRFQNLVEEAAKWKPGVVIDLEEHYSRASYVRNEKFPEDPLVVLDPVDKQRNVASVLSLEQFLIFTRHCREFVEDPGMAAFFRMPVMPPAVDELRKHMNQRDTTFAMVIFETPDVMDDVLWPQMRKCTERLKSVLEDEEFRVMRTGMWSDERTSVILLEMLVDKLPKVRKNRGPSAFDSKNSEAFIEHYRGHNMFVEDGHWVVEQEREYTDAMDLLRDTLVGDKGALKERGIPSYIAESVHHDVEVATGTHVNRILRRHSELRKYLYSYFHKNLI